MKKEKEEVVISSQCDAILKCIPSIIVMVFDFTAMILFRI